MTPTLPAVAAAALSALLCATACFYTPQGRPCLGEDASCPQDYYCHVPGIFSGTCEAYRGRGQGCQTDASYGNGSAQQCAPPLRCYMGEAAEATCQAFPAAGSPCEPALFCHGSQGEGCERYGECEVGALCDSADGEGVCISMDDD